jgi:hypothetical protein
MVEKRKEFWPQKVKVNVKLKAATMKVVIVTMQGQPLG